MSKPEGGRDVRTAAAFMANLAVELFTDALDVTLDYSPKSLNDVDRIVDELKGAGLPADQSREALLRLSYYVGEVFVKHLKGTWLQSYPEGASGRGATATRTVVRLPDGQEVDPVARLANRWKQGSGASVARLFESMTGPKRSA